MTTEFHIRRLPERLIGYSNRSYWVHEGAQNGSDFHADRWHYIPNQATIAIRNAKDHSQATIDGIEAGFKATRATAYSLAETLGQPAGRSAFVSNNGPSFDDATFDRLVADGKITGWIA